ncbi:hypothetical protein HDV03_002600 [Kappamyces sp. JEL0829]|nr:hypothetical protein HDV03_002600 [Kappamyces sp. JEL0829]
MKIEETVRRLHEIYSTTMGVLSPGIRSALTVDHAVGDLDPREMKEVKDIVMDMERLLLEDIEFDVEIHSPHRFSLSLLKLLGFDGEEGSGEIVARFAYQTYARHAWQFVNASYLCQVSLLYPPPTIALGAVLCALFESQVPLPSQLLTQTFYSRVSCDMLDCIDAAKDIVTVCIENAPESMEEYERYQRIKEELQGMQDDEEARKKLLERKPEASPRGKYDSPRPSSQFGFASDSFRRGNPPRDSYSHSPYDARDRDHDRGYPRRGDYRESDSRRDRDRDYRGSISDRGQSSDRLFRDPRDSRGYEDRRK